MVQTFAKPIEARELEARARAKKLGVRVAVVSHARRYASASRSQPGTLHRLQRTAAGWVCTCEGYFHTGCCKHLGAVERRAEREGWDFGGVAPLHRAAKYFPLDLPEHVAVQGAVLTVEPPAPSVIPFPSRFASERAERDAERYG